MDLSSLSVQVPMNGLVPDDTRLGVSVYLILMTAVLYDHLITFDKEVETIWTLKWRLPKVLFLTSRYMVVPMLILIGFAKAGYALLPAFCTFAIHFYKWADALALAIAEIVLLIRVSALYGHSRVVLGLLIGMFFCQIVAVVVETSLVMKDLTPVRYHVSLPGCASNMPVTYAYIFWFSFTCFDGLLLILTLYRVFSYGPDLCPTIKLLARDSIVCFGVMFVILLENVIVAKVPVMYPFSIPPEWIACLTVSRMMMNIRGLIFDDPHGTEGIEFSAIEFRVPPHSSDPTENEAEDYMETPEIGPESHLGCSSHV